MALLTDFETMKAILDLDKNSESDYPQLSFVMDSVDAAIQSYIKRNLELDTYTETKYLSDCERMVSLKALPVASVSKVVYRNVEIDPDQYSITPYGIELLFNAPGYVHVTYEGGEEEIHRDIKRAAALQAAYEYQNIDHVGAETVSNEGGSVQRPALGLLREVKRMLQEHVHPMGVFL